MKREILDWKRSGDNKTTLGHFARYYGALVNRAKLIRNIGFAAIMKRNIGVARAGK